MSIARVCVIGLAAITLGLTACAPVADSIDQAKAKIKADTAHLAVAIQAKATAAVNAAKSVTLFKVEIAAAGGTPVTVFNDPAGLQLNLADIRNQVKTVINVQSVPDGAYDALTLTVAKDATASQKTITIAMHIVIAAGQLTTLTVSMDPVKIDNVINGGATEEGTLSVVDTAPSTGDDSAYLEGKITAIADDKASFSFALEHSDDPAANALTVNIDANTQLVSEHGNAIMNADQLAVGDEVAVEGSLDAVTHVLTATRIEVEAVVTAQETQPAAGEIVKLMGAISADVAADATSIQVTLDMAKGELPLDATTLQVNIAATTTIVKAGSATTVGVLTKGDKVYVRGSVVRDAVGAATAAIDAEMIVAKPDETLIPHTQQVGEVEGVVSLVDATAMTFTVTSTKKDTQGNTLVALVAYTEATVWKGFAADAPLANGQSVEVTGEKNADNLWVATKIEFKPVHTVAGVIVEKRGTVSDITTDATSGAKLFILEIAALGAATVQRVAVDYTQARMMHFTTATGTNVELAAGQTVRVEGVWNATADVIVASEVKLDVKNAGTQMGG